MALTFHPSENLAILVLSDGTIYQSSLNFSSSLETEEISNLRFEMVGKITGGISAANWSPDLEILTLVTALDGRKIMLSKNFETIAEGPVQVKEFGTEEMISIGWGRKETQFHGTAGKETALTRVVVNLGLVGETEDFKSKIAWRGDGSYFAISTIDTLTEDSFQKNRRIRIYDKNGVLISTSEPVEGLESCLAWKPSGRLIASSQLLLAQKKRQIIFFERNGLCHGEFLLPGPLSRHVTFLSWNSDSTILAIQFNDGSVELWTCSNYHWYLKLHLDQIVGHSIIWDPEDPNLLYNLGKCEIAIYRVSWDQHHSGCSFDDEGCTIAVVNGKSVQLTPMAISNIPPPMSLLDISDLPSVPLALSLAPSKSTTDGVVKISVVFAFPNGEISFYSAFLTPTKSLCKYEQTGHVYTSLKISQIQFISPFMVVGQSIDGASLIVLNCVENQILLQQPLPISHSRALRLIKPRHYESLQFCVALLDRKIIRFKYSSPSNMIEFEDELCQFPELPDWISIVETSENENDIVVSLTRNHRLYINEELLLNNCNSILHSVDFLLVTTLDQNLLFLSLGLDPSQWQDTIAAAKKQDQTLNPSDASHEDKIVNEESSRRVERGTVLMLCVPQNSSVVLQVYRGNLETISPRAMVLSTLRRLLNSLQYREAYMMCRRHRIDLNFIHDYNPDLFISTIAKFVSDVASIDYLNIFLSLLREENVAVTKYSGLLGSTNKKTLVERSFSQKVNSISERILNVIASNPVDFVETIMTAYVVQTPPKLREALETVINLTTNSTVPETTVEKSLKYLLFLVHPDRLYEVALEMYNIPLAFSIARRSQKDPKDYTPFLEELASLPEIRRKFKINDYLQSYDEALRCLSQEPNFNQEEWMAYVEKHHLYRVASEITSIEQRDLYSVVMAMFGSYLLTRSDPYSATSCFKKAGRFDIVMDLSAEYGFCQDFIFSVSVVKPNGDLLKKLLAKLINTLQSKNRYQDAFDISVRYLLCFEEKIELCLKGSLWDEAIILTINESIEDRDTFISTKILPVMEGEGRKLLAELASIHDSFTEKAARIDRVQKAFLQGTFQKVASDNSDSKDVGDNISEMSFKTVSTTVSTALSWASSSSKRGKKKAERHRLRDRPGSPHEREYLFHSITELLKKAALILPDVRKIVKSLAEYAPPTCPLATLIQIKYSELIKTMKKFVDGFKCLEVKPIIFNGNVPVGPNGEVVLNPIVDYLGVKFELGQELGDKSNFSLAYLKY